MHRQLLEQRAVNSCTVSVLFRWSHVERLTPRLPVDTFGACDLYELLDSCWCTSAPVCWQTVRWLCRWPVQRLSAVSVTLLQSSRHCVTSSSTASTNSETCSVATSSSLNDFSRRQGSSRPSTAGPSSVRVPRLAVVVVASPSLHTLERCNPWPHVANHHISISQLLSLWRHSHYDVIRYWAGHAQRYGRTYVTYVRTATVLTAFNILKCSRTVSVKLCLSFFLFFFH